MSQQYGQARSAKKQKKKCNVVLRKFSRIRLKDTIPRMIGLIVLLLAHKTVGKIIYGGIIPEFAKDFALDGEEMSWFVDF
jgi:hypothetical protein